MVFEVAVLPDYLCGVAHVDLLPSVHSNHGDPRRTQSSVLLRLESPTSRLALLVSMDARCVRVALRRPVSTFGCARSAAYPVSLVH